MSAGVQQGRFLIGRFSCVKQVTKKDGTEVPGLYEIQLDVDGREWPLRASFFRTDQDGEVQKIARMIDQVDPQQGQLVAVAISTRATSNNGKSYVNDTALSIHAVEATKPQAVKAS